MRINRSINNKHAVAIFILLPNVAHENPATENPATI